MRFLFSFLLVFSFEFCNTIASPEPEILYGKVVRIIDGDSFEVLLTENRAEKIRLNGIDCPEKGQDYYKTAKNGLSELIFEKEVKIVKTDTDRYNRIVADVYNADGLYINALMVENGWAWHYKKYSDDKKIAALETKAKTEKKGLWQMEDALPPWEFRNKKRKQEIIFHNK